MCGVWLRTQCVISHCHQYKHRERVKHLMGSSLPRHLLSTNTYSIYLCYTHTPTTHRCRDSIYTETQKRKKGNEKYVLSHSGWLVGWLSTSHKSIQYSYIASFFWLTTFLSYLIIYTNSLCKLCCFHQLFNTWSTSPAFYHVGKLGPLSHPQPPTSNPHLCLSFSFGHLQLTSLLK